MFKNPKLALIDFLGLSIVILCAALLAIWAMQHTIALRNILLSIGCLLSIVYVYQRKKIAPFSMGWLNLIPILFICCLFVWVIFHYFLLSQDPTLQLKELRSIWFRSAEAAFLGWVCGLAISQRPARLNLLAYGLLLGFAVLYSQYLPKVWATHQLFHPDHLNYIFYGKINGVLMGTLLVAGTGGCLIDLLSDESAGRLKIALNIALSVSVIAVPMYAYVFIFDAKNGIGLSIILAVVWSLWAMNRFLGFHSPTHSWRAKLISVATVSLLLTLIAGFGGLQLKQNPSWQYLVEDVEESIQIDKYPQWRSPSTLGYPSLPSGRVITPNVFERVSWATAGLRLITSNPWGNGILQYPFERSLMRVYPNLRPNSLPGSTHSGWIELLLSFGFPALICLWGALVAVAYGAIKGASPFKGFLMSLVIAIFSMYTVGELSNHHAVEILIFSILFLTGLSAAPSKK